MVCIHRKCKEKRLGCSKCICELHTDHANKCVFLEDILKNNGENSVPNWTNLNFD